MEVEKKEISGRESRDTAEAEDGAGLPGFRFHPTDEELVGFYLRRKVEKKFVGKNIINQIDIYRYDPWDLPMDTVGVESKEWYFFCLRERKYRNSVRPNRVTGSGFWKATGIDKPIYSATPSGRNNSCIGLKKSLVYYQGSAGKGTKTNWMMHEFRLPTTEESSTRKKGAKVDANQEADTWTLCRIFKRINTSKPVAISSSTPRSRSAESSIVDDCKCSGTLDQENEMSSVFRSFDDDKNNQSFDGLWNNLIMPQTPLINFHESFQSSEEMTSDYFENGNWDELGRLIDFQIDTDFFYECRS